MNKTYRILDSATICDGFFTLKRYRLQHGSFDGGWCDEVVRERVENLAAVSVLLFDPDRDELVVVERACEGAVKAFPRFAPNGRLAARVPISSFS